MEHPTSLKTDPTHISKEAALKFVVLIGVVSLFADMTYEGARSVTGPYLAILGASGTVVGIVAGLGELIGYGLRLASGYICDRTGRYWAVTIVGYVVNMAAVPLLALAGRWELAALLTLAPGACAPAQVRVSSPSGRARPSAPPARDAMLSHAAHQMGRGWAFGLHEALDQIGVILGPLIVAGVLYFKGNYQIGFGALLAPALLAVSVLVAARFLYPRPQDLEIAPPQLKTGGFHAPSGSTWRRWRLLRQAMRISL